VRRMNEDPAKTETGAAARLEATRERWRTSRRWSLAVVVASFPFVFVVDEALDLAFSPVLPSLAALGLLLVVLPFGIMEILERRALRTEGKARWLHRQRLAARSALGVAWAWFAAWFVLGV